MLSDFLKDYRQDNALSQSKFAEFLGITQSSLARWELGKSEPTASDIKKIAIKLNITTDYLLGLDVDEQKMTAEENLLRHYRQLSADSRELANGYIQNLLNLEQENKGVQKNA